MAYLLKIVSKNAKYLKIMLDILILLIYIIITT